MPADVRSGPDRLYAEHDKGRLTRPSPQLVQCTRASLRRGSWFVDRPQKAELVGAPSVGQRIHHKVDAPNLVRTCGHLSRLTIPHYTLATPTLAHAQRSLPVQPIDLLVVRLHAFSTQQIMDAAVAESSPRVRQVNDSGLQRGRLRRFDHHAPQCCSGKPHKPAGAPLGDRELLAHLEPAPAGWKAA